MQRYFSPHWYYAETCEQFLCDFEKENGEYLQRFLEHSQEFRGDERNEREVKKWPGTFAGLKRIIEGSGLTANQIAILEYRFDTRQRIDAILCGCNEEGEDTAFLFELKSWFKNGTGFDLRSAEGKQKILVKVPEGAQEILHPSVQLNNYRERIQFLLDRHFWVPENIKFKSAVYLHDMKCMPKNWSRVLYSSKFKDETDDSRIYNQINEDALFERVSENLSYGSGLSTMQKLIHISPVK